MLGQRLLVDRIKIEKVLKSEGNIHPGILVQAVSQALAGAIPGGIHDIFLHFISRFDGHTTWFGNVYGQSYSFRILLHVSKVVIPCTCFMNTKDSETRHELVMPREICAQLASAWDRLFSRHWNRDNSLKIENKELLRIKVKMLRNLGP